MTPQPRAAIGSIALLSGFLLLASPAGATTDESVVNGGAGEDRVEYNINPPASGDPPLYWPLAVQFSFPASSLPGPGPFRLTFSDEHGVVPPAAGTYVFELVVTDSTGQRVDQLAAPARFGFVFDAASPPDAGGACLGYLDVDRNPPQWQCEDATLEVSCDSRDGFYCGTTDHLTLFSIGPVPEPSTGLLLGLGGALLAAKRRRRAG